MIKKSFFILICLVFNIYHLYKIFQEYFAYDVTTNVIIEQPDQLIIPDLVFCYELPYVIDWEHLSTQDFRTLIKVTNETHTREKFELFESLKNITRPSPDHIKKVYKLMENNNYPSIRIDKYYSNPSYILKNLTQKHLIVNETQHDFKNSIMYWMKIMFEKKEMHMIASQRYFNHRFNSDSFLLRKNKCYLIQKKRPFNVNYHYIKQYGNVDSSNAYLMSNKFGNIIIMSLEFKSIPSMQLMIIPSGYPVIQSLESFILDNKALNKFTFDFSESTLLPFPYKTDCFDYSASSVTQEGCRHDCGKQEFIRRKGLFLPNTIIKEDDYGRYPGKSEHIDENELINVSNKCQKECSKKDCHLISFNKRKLVTEDVGNQFQEFIYIDIEASKNNVIRTETIPSIQFFVFLTNVLSTFGIYFGLSLLSFEFILKKTVGFIFKRNKPKRKKQLTRQLKRLQQDIDRLGLRRRTNRNHDMKQRTFSSPSLKPFRLTRPPFKP